MNMKIANPICTAAVLIALIVWAILAPASCPGTGEGCGSCRAGCGCTEAKP